MYFTPLFVALCIVGTIAQTNTISLWPSNQICTGEYADVTPCCCAPGNEYYLYVFFVEFDLSSIPAGATVTSATLYEAAIYTQGPADLITSAVDADSISGASYYDQPPRISPPLNSQQVASTGYLQQNTITVDVTAEVNRVLGIGRNLNLVQYNNAGSSWNYDFVEFYVDTGNIGYSSPDQQPHVTITYTTAPPPGAPCQSDGDCVPFSGGNPYATCNNGACQCLDSFSGYGTSSNPCNCASPNVVAYDSNNDAHCLAPGQCLPGRQDLCMSVSNNYNYVSCGSDNRCHCDAGFSGTATVNNPCDCVSPATVSWDNNGNAHCNQPGQCTADYLCYPYSTQTAFVSCGSNGACQCNAGFSGLATINSLCYCNGNVTWDNTQTPSTASCTSN